jgi:hypothetical protein
MGFFVDLRIGPYVCAEWSWGGYPYDIGNVPGALRQGTTLYPSFFQVSVYIGT